MKNTHLEEGKETTQSKDGQGLSDLYLISNLFSDHFVGVVQGLNLSSLLKIRLLTLRGPFFMILRYFVYL